MATAPFKNYTRAPLWLKHLLFCKMTGTSRQLFFRSIRRSINILYIVVLFEFADEHGELFAVCVREGNRACRRVVRADFGECP